MNKTNKAIIRSFIYLILCLISLMLVLIASGCGSQAAPIATEPEPELVVDIKTPVLGARPLEDGRMIGGSVRGRLIDEFTTAFFAFQARKAEYATSIEEEHTPMATYIYLAVELTIEGVYDKSVPMWTSDFVLRWADGDQGYGYPIEKLSESQMSDTFYLRLGDSITKQLVFEVPETLEGVEYSLSYLEYYADDVEGNTFYIVFDMPPVV